jgi:DNA replication protein DnaC
MKTLEKLEFARAPQIAAAKIRELAEGGYIAQAELVVLIGECGTGKTHLATGLCVAACRQKRRVRFTTAANLETSWWKPASTAECGACWHNGCATT